MLFKKTSYVQNTSPTVESCEAEFIQGNAQLMQGNPTEKLVKLSQAKWTGVPRQSFILNGNHVSVSVGSGLILFLKSISHMYVYVHKQVH